MKALGLALAILIVVMLPMAAAAQESDKDIVVDLVDKSVAMFKQKGKDQTLKTLNSPAGPLRRGALYAFAVTFKGQMLSHPTQEDLRGKDTWELQDAKGKFIIQDVIKVARDQGQGWYEYSWIRVGETTPRMKRTYIKRVPGEDIFVGAGYYIKSNPAPNLSLTCHINLGGCGNYTVAGADRSAAEVWYSLHDSI